jgi:hypothetical protein
MEILKQIQNSKISNKKENMSYLFEDLFNDEILPELKKLVSDEFDDKSEKFLNILRSCVQHDNRNILTKKLLDVIVDEHEVYLFIRECFSIKFDEKELKKIEYSDNSTIIKVDYDGERDQQVTDKISF